MTYVSATAIIALTVFVFGASRWMTQAPPSPSGPAVEVPVSKTLSASSVDVRIAIARVFGNAIFLSDVTNPTFVSSDLNGDGAEDLAVAVTTNPDERVAANGELANWTVNDVQNVELPNAGKAIYRFHQKHHRVILRKNQTLLAVVHGVGELGWRSPEASQAFLLVNTPTEKLSHSDMLKLNREGVSLPRTTIYPTQALIAESSSQTLAVYWSGAQYAGVPVKGRSVQLASRE
jgi:hypothetical protein